MANNTGPSNLDKKSKATVIGAGLAGCEAAWQLARFGVEVTLHEQKPLAFSPAHKSEGFAELVCSNSLRADGLQNAVGLLKQEMRELGSLIMQAADECKVPAGGALAVDREAFSRFITKTIEDNEYITVERGEVSRIPEEDIVIIAAGPLVSGPLAEDISRAAGGMLSFYDAAAPIVTGESVDLGKAFWASRYGKGGSDYLNCPMNEDEYRAFWEALVGAETAQVHGFEDDKVFEGCMPVETMAKRGYQTLTFGPLKPVGITCPDGSKPYAVAQLRREDTEGRLLNIVGFQTHLKFGEQKRVFRMIPGLENSEFERLGVMHRNTYLGPRLLNENYELKSRPGFFFAGQITGVEGYVESASSGLIAGISAAHDLTGISRPVFSADTATGALARYVSGYAGGDFQPMNITFGLMNRLDTRAKRADRKLAVSERALVEVRKTVKEINEYVGEGFHPLQDN